MKDGVRGIHGKSWEMITGCCQTLFIRRWEAFKGFKVKNVLRKAHARRFVEKPYMGKMAAEGF